jgi:uncharacterized membrane protein YidH (DUF202 family)
MELDGRRAGLILTGLGILSISVGMAEYFLTIRDIRERFPVPRWRYSLVIAGIMLMIGLAIFVLIWTQLA